PGPRSRLRPRLPVPPPRRGTGGARPPAAASLARLTRWPGRSERKVSPLSPRSAARRAISGQRLPVAPLSAAGLTRKAVSLMRVRRDRRQSDAGHPVDRGLEVLVRDPGERSLDDD